MRSVNGAAAALIVALAAAAGGAAPPAVEATRVPTPDQLASKIRAVDAMEIEAGRLAQARGSTDGVRRYGLVLERDHRLADRRVTALANAQGLTLTEVPPSAEEAAEMARLGSLRGAAFDDAFLKAMKAGHGRTLELLAKARQSTPDLRLADLISRLIPILEQHDQLAGGLAASARGG